MLQLNWAQATVHFRAFKDKSTWSLCIAHYMLGACHFEAGNFKECEEAWENLEELSLLGPRKKASDMEKWACRRADGYFAAEKAGTPGRDRIVQPGYELMHIWNCFGQNPPALPKLAELLGESDAAPTTDKECLQVMMRASVARYSGDYAKCIALADQVIALHKAGGLKGSDDIRVVPNCILERGLAKLAQGQPGAAKVDFLLAKRFKPSKYDFYNRTSSWLKDCIKECGDAGPADDEADKEAEEDQRKRIAEMEAEAGMTLIDDADSDDEDGSSGSGGGSKPATPAKVVAL